MKGEDCLLMEYDNPGWPVNAEVDFKVTKRFNSILDRAFKLSKAIMDVEKLTNIKTKIEENTNGNSVSVPKGANSLTSFGTIFEYVAATDHLGREADLSILKEVSDLNLLRTGGYPQNSIESSLFGWHVMNLEMSCGTTFDELGLTWNDDECWGFGGDHVLLREGFGSLIECLKDGLDICYGTEVKGIRIIEDDDDDCYQPMTKNDVFNIDDSRNTCMNACGNISVENSSSSKRRSTRTNKGKIDRINIGHLSSEQKQLGTYDISDGLVTAHKHLKGKQSSDSTTKQRKFPVQVRTASPHCSVLEADAIVCTIPLGVLSVPEGKPGHVQFIPPLPERKKSAIERIGVGNYNKCVLTFPRAFWSSSSDFVGVVGSPVAGTDVLFCNVSVVQDGLPLLVFLYGGKNAEEVEKLSDVQIVGECLDIIQRVCGKSKVPPPIDYFVTRWGMDRFARGSFMYCPAGVQGETELQVMSQPILKKNKENGKEVSLPVLLFAGESTTPYHPSTIHGAWISGIREAYRLDFAMYPEENNNLKFKDSFLYQPTFGLRRRFGAQHRTKKVETLGVVQMNSSSRKTYMDRQAKVSTFPQKRKINDRSDDMNRRSRRKNEGCEDSDQSSSILATNVYCNNNGQSEHFTNSEDIALLRGVDTFGRDDDAMNIILKLIFPVPDTNNIHTRNKKINVSVLQQRYDELVSEGADREVSCQSKNANWTASKKSISWWESREKLQSPKIYFRKSPRKSKLKFPTCYEDL